MLQSYHDTLISNKNTSRDLDLSRKDENVFEEHVKFGGVDHVDSIILMYDLERNDTLLSVENYWLPLIEKCFNDKVWINCSP